MSHHCPRCGSVFDTRRGLGVHHTTKHHERMPNRECERCGVEFHSSYQKKYCSDSCRDEAISYSGSSNPNYKGGKRTTTCEICGSEFDYYPSAKVGRYCSECVASENWQTVPVKRGAENPRWTGGKNTYECHVCQDSVDRYPSEVTGSVVICSEECRQVWLSESFSGDGHPNWRGGGNEPYGKGWSEIRKKALKRDGYSCMICSQGPAELGRNPDVHHIIPVRKFVESDQHTREDAHELENVVTLCASCHRSAEFGNIRSSRLRFLIGPKPGRVE